MIVRVPETGSTNADLAARLGPVGRATEGDWLVADRQSAGRGRQGRVWCDGVGNFMGSTVVHLRAGDPVAGSLALVAANAVYVAVADRLVPPQRAVIKWPNDVMVGRAKLAGTLLERVGDTVIVGIGVNLAQAPVVEGRETVALSAFGPPPDRDAFAADLERAFAAELALWRNSGLSATIARWQAAAHPPGTPLSVSDGSAGRITGTFAGLDAEGALQLALADGTRRTIHAGEVFFAE